MHAAPLPLCLNTHAGGPLATRRQPSACSTMHGRSQGRGGTPRGRSTTRCSADARQWMKVVSTWWTKTRKARTLRVAPLGRAQPTTPASALLLVDPSTPLRPPLGHGAPCAAGYINKKDVRLAMSALGIKPTKADIAVSAQPLQAPPARGRGSAAPLSRRLVRVWRRFAPRC